MHPLKTIFRVCSALLLTALFALLGSAVAQTPAQGVAATNSSPSVVVPPASVPATNQPPQGAPYAPASASPPGQLVPATNQPPHAAPANNSIESLREKAEAGDAESQFNLGIDYDNGYGVEKDAAEAVKWYRKAADQGDALAQYSLGGCYREGYGVGKDEAEATKWFRKAADQGVAKAQYDLGVCYHDGTGVEKDDVEAVKWFRKAADQGYDKAQYNLGVSYREGYGVEKDDVEAVKWFRKSADQGDAQAQYSLGVCYYDGTGFEKDAVEAVKWFRKAADQGYDKAQYNLGVCYHDGTGVKKDAVEAVKWYRKAADQGYDKAQYNLGVCYHDGTGVEKDDVEAIKWVRKSADQGDAQAQYSLGIGYYNGYGVEKNAVEAAKWFRKAADQGNALAQGWVGLLYIQGLGVIKNEVEGLAWFYVSSASGDMSAANVISAEERTYNAAIIEAARQRATEIQAQIASHLASNPDDSISATLHLAPASNTPKASGSGAFISTDGLVLTAAHVVQGALRVEVVTPTGSLSAKVVRVDATNDVALLKCAGSNFIPLPIAPSKAARAGTSVFTVGFPNIQLQGFDPKLTQGGISSQTGFQDDPRQWQISVPIQPGNSGGPLCDENGNLIGIVESTLNPLMMAKYQGEIPQNVNYAVKSSYILPLLDDVQNLPQPRVATSGKKFEDVVDSVRPSAVLILVY